MPPPRHTSLVPTISPVELVIFDCDGVLVDSEAIALEVMRAALVELGLTLDLAAVRRRCLGRSLATVVAELREEGYDFDAARREAMGEALRARFRSELVAMPGMAALIDRLAVPACVASSSHTARLHGSLRIAGLWERFERRIFSADEVARGKPAPDLFLHAARAMNASPAACLVVEDSQPGLEAARAAGMRAVAFMGGSHLDAESRAALRAHARPTATDTEINIATDADALAAHLPLR